MWHIYTRQQKNGKWWCNGTINGYDRSFEADSVSMAQFEMKQFLHRTRRLDSECKWHEPEYCKHIAETANDKYQVGYRVSRIDNNPFG